MLIVMQDPDATVVHGFHDWKAQGRRVRKGEHSHISILAPAGEYRTSDGGRVKTGDEQPTADGESVRRFFRLAAVFDIRQTITEAEYEAQRAAEAIEDDEQEE
jgi:hypothetical protein